jgi:hypothetical protein
LLALARCIYLEACRQRRKDRIEPRWNRKYASRPLGTVPNFRRCQTAWDGKLRRTRLRGLYERVTVPEEFVFNRGSRNASTRRAELAAKRQERIYLEHVLVEAGALEQRWPHCTSALQVQLTQQLNAIASALS